jgi:two-component system OmpR family sensor kinase
LAPKLISVAHTLRARLVVAATGSILAAVALFGGAAALLVRHELRGSLDTALRQRAELVANLAVSAPAVLAQPGALESPVSGRQIAVEVIDSHGVILARSAALGASLLPQDAAVRAARVDGRAGFEDIRTGGRQFRRYAAPVAQAGGQAAGGAVLVASDTSDITHTVHRLAFVLFVSGVVAALLAALAAAALTRRGLRPLRRLADAAGQIGRTGNPAERLPEPRAADEIAELTSVLNGMLEALEQSRASERRFLADASHELRTPVTSLLGNVEYVARHGADPGVLDDLRREAKRLAHLVDDLLVLEREGGTTALQARTVAVAKLVVDVVQGFPDGRVELGQVESVDVEGDADALRRVLGNLIENGLVHGPSDGRVTVTLGEQDGRAVITVSDQGPGPDAAERDRIFERFWRGPAATQRPGSGLGLSIAATIVERHGGRISVDGSTFTIELPSVRP